MSASITLAGLAWALPDGRPLFQDINLQFGSGRVGLIGRNGAGKTTLLRLIAGDLPPSAGSVRIGGRVEMLRQSVQVDAHQTIADLFGARAGLDLLARAAQGDASASELEEADWTLGERMTEALARVNLDAPPETPLAALSGGQRTMASIAALIFRKPDFLLLDEPTNNLDRHGRLAVISLLETWRSGAVVVSHDRELLETMDAIVELGATGATRYGGNWSLYRERKAIELAAAERDVAGAQKLLAALRASAQERAERQDRRDSGGRRKAARGDMPKILSGGQKNRAEGSRGQDARLAERRRAQAVEAVNEAQRRVEVLQRMTVSLPSTGLPSEKMVLRMENVDAGYRSGDAILRGFSLRIVGPERIAVVGPNGSGKTTLLSVISGALQPTQGRVSVLTSFAMLDQRVSVLDPEKSIRDNFRRIHPGGDENACRAALARFMFRADATLQTVGLLSGGQLLRAGLACVLGGSLPPPLLILDEPANHLDIQSIEAMEAGLLSYDGALMIASHDEAFLANVRTTRRIELGVVGKA